MESLSQHQSLLSQELVCRDLIHLCPGHSIALAVKHMRNRLLFIEYRNSEQKTPFGLSRIPSFLASEENCYKA